MTPARPKPSRLWLPASLLGSMLIVCQPLALGRTIPLPAGPPDSNVDITFFGGVFYDDNVFLTNENIEPVGDQEPLPVQGSFVLEYQPRIRLRARPSDRTSLSLQYDLSAFYFFDRLGDSERYNHILRGNASHQLTPRLSVQGSAGYFLFRNAPEIAPEDFPFRAPSFITQNQSSRTINAGLNSTYLVSERTRASVGFSFADFTLEDDLRAETQDRSVYSTNASLTRAFNPQLNGILSFGYSRFAYDNLLDFEVEIQPGLFGDILLDQDLAVSSFTVGGDYTFSPRLTASGSVGVSRINRLDPRFGELFNSGSNLNFTASGNLVYTYQPESTVRLEIEVFDRESDQPGVFVNETVAVYILGFDHRLSARFRLGGTVSTSSTESVPLDPEDTANLFNERDTRGGLSLTYFATSKWAVVISYDFQIRSSNQISREWNRNRFGVTFGYNFGVGFPGFGSGGGSSGEDLLESGNSPINPDVEDR